MIPLVVGTLLALAALSFVLYPLLSGGNSKVAAGLGHNSPSVEESSTGAVDALREIEFDRATGKLSDTDYENLKSSYTRRAISVMRGEGGSICERCGPRPEADASFCSNCGRPLAA